VTYQDRRVMVSQEPKPSGLGIGETLIQGDRPIAEYRRREALIEPRAKRSRQARLRTGTRHSRLVSLKE
jgi:hypothetical protein